MKRKLEAKQAYLRHAGSAETPLNVPCSFKYTFQTFRHGPLGRGKEVPHLAS